MSAVTLRWAQLYNTWYRKIDMSGDVYFEDDFSQRIIFACPFAGPIAMIKDPGMILRVKDTTSSFIKITSSCGDVFCTIEPDYYKSIVKLGWNDNERLVVVLEDGTVFIYSVHGRKLRQFHLEGECVTEGVIDCHIWGSGLVCLTGNYQLYALMDFEEPYTIKLANPGLEVEPVCWTIIEPQLSVINTLEVLVATESGTILVITRDKVEDMVISSNGPFSRLSVSPNGKYIACFTKDKSVWIVTADFSTNLTTFNTKSEPPRQLVWCGNESVICYFERHDPEKNESDYLLFMIGANLKYISYNYNEPVYLVPECDGVRIIGKNTLEFLEKVPDVTVDIFLEDSKSHSSHLYKAAELFSQENPKADKYIRLIGQELPNAVDLCIEAAGHEFDVNIQKKLLNAASFGKAFLDFYDPEYFVSMAKDLRILNAVRSYRIGIPLTYQQYNVLHVDLLISRLTHRHHHQLAYEICKYMDRRTDDVLVHWSSMKVQYDQYLSDNEMANQIVDKLKELPGVNFAQIAATAHREGRKELAIRLLDYEPRASEQVPLLITMDQLRRALAKAMKSGDTDLVHLVLIHMLRSPDISPTELQEILHEYEDVRKLWLSLCTQEGDSALAYLIDAYDYSNRPDKIARLKIEKQYDMGDELNYKKLEESQHLYEDNQYLFESAMTGNQIALLVQQNVLEQNDGRQHLGNSLSETLYDLYYYNQGSQASKLAKKFDVPPKRLSWIKLRALADVGDWEEIEKWAKNKIPIGLVPVADVCIDKENFALAAKIIKRLRNNDDKAVLFGRIG
eukprot:TRINITY_DN5935_c0_g1_i2.p1 TRINITY_DN5935_c0_g1~~TRINITY_DN5935_c0_g1_i2.p1  ORF type:complete len:791 (-),score=174.87 TRINITY_DN5935_c0_g1_i2:57-2429(-)